MASSGKLRIFVLGKGAREHALAWKLSQSPSVEHIFVIPGNGGTAQGLDNVSNIDHVKADDPKALVQLAHQHRIGLVVVGPDSLIVEGIAGPFQHANIPCFAPSKHAAIIEGSKKFAKEFMRRYGIPTAEHRSFDRSTIRQAREYIESIHHRIVIKADGLAAGKGVILPSSVAEALSVIDDILGNDRFGSAGHSIVIEDFLEGPEISLSTLFDGRTHWSFAIGQDHKRIQDGDQGPNTGGMGVYAPVPFVSEELASYMDELIIKPTFEGMRKEGRPFCGLLFTGVILTEAGPKVLEYNARFGDPETQSILPLLRADVDFAQLLLACVDGRLDEVDMHLSTNATACGVVISAAGYPGVSQQADRINIGRTPQDCMVFHAGTRLQGGELLTSGGRVLTVVGLSESPEEAARNAYEAVMAIHFDGMHYRTDIAHTCLKHQQQTRTDLKRRNQ